MRLRRSELSTPASSEKMMEKAAASTADFVFLDLEDAVAPNQKAEARGKAVKALKTLDWGKKTRAIRINGVDTQYAHEDIIQMVTEAGDHIDVIIIPKPKAARDVWWVDTLITQLETKLGREHRIKLEALIEEVEGLINVEEIARSSPRLEALIFGPGDFSASQGVRLAYFSKYPGDTWHYARNKIVVACRAAGIDAIDGPYADFKNPEGYREDATRAMILGFVGKWAIHPSQIDIANEVYSPTKKEVDYARKVVTAYAQAEAEGQGAIAIDGVLIDVASVRGLRNIVAKADLIGI
jgi:citrate lyase subunit beta/citryl-CoA lyase